MERQPVTRTGHTAGSSPSPSVPPCRPACAPPHSLCFWRTEHKDQFLSFWKYYLHSAPSSSPHFSWACSRKNSCLETLSLKSQTSVSHWGASSWLSGRESRQSRKTQLLAISSSVFLHTTWGWWRWKMWGTIVSLYLHLICIFKTSRLLCQVPPIIVIVAALRLLNRRPCLLSIIALLFVSTCCEFAKWKRKTKTTLAPNPQTSITSSGRSVATKLSEKRIFLQLDRRQQFWIFLHRHCLRDVGVNQSSLGFPDQVTSRHSKKAQKDMTRRYSSSSKYKDLRCRGSVTNRMNYVELCTIF